MNKPDEYIYPALLIPEEDGGYSVVFPDLPGCYTQGETLKEASSAAQEALELHMYGLEEDADEIPAPSLPESIEREANTYLVPIRAYMPLARTEIDSRVVKKTLTLPRYWEQRGKQSGVNFSKLLLTALKDYLGSTDRSN